MALSVRILLHRTPAQVALCLIFVPFYVRIAQLDFIVKILHQLHYRAVLGHIASLALLHATIAQLAIFVLLLKIRLFSLVLWVLILLVIVFPALRVRLALPVLSV